MLTKRDQDCKVVDFFMMYQRLVRMPTCLPLAAFALLALLHPKMVTFKPSEEGTPPASHHSHYLHPPRQGQWRPSSVDMMYSCCTHPAVADYFGYFRSRMQAPHLHSDNLPLVLTIAHLLTAPKVAPYPSYHSDTDQVSYQQLRRWQ
jgi:hypothetical protein